VQGGPLMHVIAAKAVAFKEALEPSFKVYQQQIVNNAAVLAETLMSAGLKLVSDGTDNHLMVVDLSPKGLTGKAAAAALDNAGITTSKSTVPNDPQKPFITSGVRIGTPALTTRGMKEAEMKIIGGFIATVLGAINDEVVIAKVRGEVAELSKGFPLYQLAD
jgi:glycine hydroxymethyltransferase